MAYPPEIYLGDEQEEGLKNKLRFVIDNHRAERSGWVNDLRRYQKDYWASPNVKEKVYPFVGASNLVIPLTAIVTEAVHARVMQRLFSLDHLVSCKFNDPFWSKYDRPIERCLDWQLMDQMKIRDQFENVVLEIIKLGTGVMKDGYRRVEKTVVIDGEPTTTVQYAGPWVEPVPVANFLMPFTSQDPQTSDWVGEEHTDNQYQFLLNEQTGLFRPGSYQALTTWFTATSQVNLSSQPYTQELDVLENQQPVWPSRIGWYEIYMPWGSDDERLAGKKKEIVVLYHYDSNSILSIRDNWNPDGRRPYEVGVYMKVENRWAGIGVAKQSEQFQREVTVQHRQRLDAGTLANANMLKVKKLSGVSPNEPVFPGKLWFVDEMDDVMPFQLGGTYPAASNNEQQTLYYAQQRSGINELTLGMPQAGTPGTATSDMARVQESGLKFDYNISNIRNMLTRIITNTVCNIHTYGLSDPRYYEFVPEGRFLEQFFQLPISLLRSGIICKFEVVGQSANKVLDRNNWLQLTQIFTQYYQNAMGVAQMTQQPQLVLAVALQSLNASTIAFRHILESYDIPNPDKLTLSSLINGLIPGSEGAGQNLGGGQGFGAPSAVPIGAPTDTGNPTAVPTIIG